MERKFAAFISYRHLELDMAVAKQLHRSIERYRIPRELRKDGKKSLGLVFRDREELPLTNNLTEDIYEALDNSDFLIVVCTPDTPKSLWCRREIQHFIEKHGRDRIITVLAAGTPQESIPPEITTVYGPDGVTVVEQYEPLCAYLVDEDPKKVMRNLKKELLRLYAAMLGCPYDELRQRHKRRKLQQFLTATAIALAVALAFIGMLVNKNRTISDMNVQIQQQLYQSQINESQALALNSRMLLASNDRRGAVESALTALPSEESQRPYIAEAHAALADAMYLYTDMDYRVDSKFTQYDPIDKMALSRDGHFAATLAWDTVLRCVDLDSQQELWRYACPHSSSWPEYLDYEQLFFTGENNAILVCESYVHCICTETGGQLWEHPLSAAFAVPVISGDGKLLSLYAEGVLQILDTASGRLLLEKDLTAGSFGDGAFQTNAAHFVLLCQDGIYGVDLTDGAVQRYPLDQEQTEIFLDPRVTPLPDGGFLLTYANVSGSDYIRLSKECEPVCNSRWDNRDIDYLEKYRQAGEAAGAGVWNYSGELKGIAVRENTVYYFYDTFFRAVSAESGEVLDSVSLSGELSAAAGDGETVTCLYADGTLEVCKTNTDGTLSRISTRKIDIPFRNVCTQESDNRILGLISGSNAYFLRSLSGANVDQPEVVELVHEMNYSSRFLCDPAGKYVVATDYSTIGPVYDLETGEVFPVTLSKRDRITVAGTEIYPGSVLGFSSDGGSVLLESGLVMSLSTGEVSWAEGPTESLFYSLDPEEGVLHWCNDLQQVHTTQLPIIPPESASRHIKTGENGLIAIYIREDRGDVDRQTISFYNIEEDRWQVFENPYTEEYSETCFLTQKKQVVLSGPEKTLDVYDFQTNEILHRIPSPLDPIDISDIDAILEDTCLVVTANDGPSVFVVDMTDGEILYRMDRSDEEWTEQLLIRELPERGTLILGDQVLDVQSWTLLYQVPDLIGYQTSQNKFLCRQGDQLLLWQDYTVSQLTQKGRQLLRGELY